jgi:hypothetical protein
MTRATGDEVPAQEPQETLRPGPRETVEAELQEDDGEHLRHILCTTCYPAFEGAREAPQDAVCVCGKRIRAGDRRNSRGNAHCVLCDGLWPHHNATAHT